MDGSSGGTLRLPAKASIYYIVTASLAKSVGILTTPVFTRLLSNESYGKYTLYMSILGLSTIICSTGISPTVIYRGLEKFKGEKNSFVFSASVSGFCFTAAISLLLFIIMPFAGLGRELTFVLCIQLFCDILINLFQTYRRHSYNYLALSITNGISVSLTPLLSIFLIFGGVGYKGRIYALLIVSMGIAAVHLSRLLASAKLFNKKLTVYVIKHTLPLLPNSVATAVSAEADKLILGGIMGAEALAKYSVAHTLGLGVGFAVSAVCASLYPWVIRKLASGCAECVLPISNAILLSISALGISLALFLPEIFALLAPAVYFEARQAALPLILSALSSFSTSFITLGIVEAERGGYTCYTALVSLFSGIIFSFILIPPFGYIGAGLSVLLSSLTALPTNYLFLKKCGNSEIFSTRDFIKIFLLTLFGVTAAALTENSLSVRIFIFTLPVTILFFVYSQIKELILES